MLKERPSNRTVHKKNCLCLLALFSRLLCVAIGASLRLGGEVYDDASIITPAHGASPVRDAHSTALALDERVSLELVVRAAGCRLRPVVTHAYDHGDTIANRA